MVHRLGAVVVLLYIGVLSLYIMRSQDKQLRATGVAMAALLAVQIALGIGNVLLSLPLPVAVAHNGTAALLLLSVVTLNHLLHPKTIKQAHEYPNSAVQSAPTVA